jgi:hypothetical protein
MIRRTVRTERGLSTTVQELKNGDTSPGAPGTPGTPPATPGTPPHGGVTSNGAAQLPPCQICGQKPVSTRVNTPGMPARLTCVDCMHKLTQGKPVAHTTVAQPEAFLMVHSAPQPVGIPRR